MGAVGTGHKVKSPNRNHKKKYKPGRNINSTPPHPMPNKSFTSLNKKHIDKPLSIVLCLVLHSHSCPYLVEVHYTYKLEYH